MNPTPEARELARLTLDKLDEALLQDRVDLLAEVIDGVRAVAREIEQDRVRATLIRAIGRVDQALELPEAGEGAAGG